MIGSRSKNLAPYSIQVRLLAETDSAYKVSDGVLEAWVAKSLCTLCICEGKPNIYCLTAPEWWLRKYKFV